MLRKNGSNVQLLNNGVVVKSAPAATLSDVNISDPNASNDALTVDYSFGGVFAAQIYFDHAAAAGDDAVAVALPKGSNNIDFTPTAANAGAITAAGPARVSFAGVEKVVVNGHSGGDKLTVTTPSDASVTVTPGALEDEGHVSIRSVQSRGARLSWASPSRISAAPAA